MFRTLDVHIIISALPIGEVVCQALRQTIPFSLPRLPGSCLKAHVMRGERAVLVNEEIGIISIVPQHYLKRFSYPMQGT